MRPALDRIFTVTAERARVDRKREAEIAASVAEIPMPELLAALRNHSGELQAWLDKEPAPASDFLGGKDARLADFDPLESWTRIVEILATAERRAKANNSKKGRA